MNYISVIKCDTANGHGVRVSLFVSGCARKCPGCFNPESHNPDNGKKFTEDTKKLIFCELDKPYVNGISLLGGDPLSKLSDNRTVILNLVKEIKEKYPTKTIYMWTGYTIEEIQNDSSISEILNYIDVLIDGPFIESLKDLSLELRGSSNQRIIYLNCK